MSKKGNKVTIANFVTVLGLALTAFFVFCGHSLQNYESNIGTTIIVALGFVIATSLVLWLMVYAKGVEDNFKKWRVVEIGASLVFVVIIFFSGVKMMKFFVVYEKADLLKEVAFNDVNELKRLINNFKTREGERCDTYKNGYDNVGSGNYELSGDVSEHIEWLYDEGGEEYFEKMKFYIGNITIYGNNSTSYGPAWKDDIKELENIVDSWNFIKLPDAARLLTRLSREMPMCMQEASQSYDFKVMDTSHGKMMLYNSEPNTYSCSVSFPAALTDATSVSIVGILLIILVNLMVLANYIFAYRSNKVDYDRKNDSFSNGAAL